MGNQIQTMKIIISIDEGGRIMKHLISDFKKFEPSTCQDTLNDFDYDEKARTLTMVISYLSGSYSQEIINELWPDGYDSKKIEFALVTFYDVDKLDDDFEKTIALLEKSGWYYEFLDVSVIDGRVSFMLDTFDWKTVAEFKFSASSFDFEKSKDIKLEKHFNFSKEL